MKKLIISVLVLVITAAAAAGAYYYRRKGPEVQVSTAQVSRGDVLQSVGATGTLEAIQTVNVGSQVSGNVQALYADFNSIVKKGQLVAKLDPSMMQTQVEQAKANLVRSQAELERLKVSLEDARTKLNRAEGLSAKKLLPQSELDTAVVNAKSIEVQIRSQQAAITQAEASLNQNQVNLDHTAIYSPIDGIVISRNVDVGQTVAASMQAPTLFMIAVDLSHMQVRASVDESDVGLIRPGQPVTFRVDAYPQQEFAGSVAQVRLQPIVSQNVVTYVTVIDVPNPQLKLKPGMTANVTIEIARRQNALRAPNAALRFRPTTEMFEALNQPIPPELQRGGARAQGSGAARGGDTSQPGAAQRQEAPSASPAGAPANAAATAPGAAPVTPGATRRDASPAGTPTGRLQGASADSRGGTSGGELGQRRGEFGGGQQGSGGGQGMDPQERQRRFQERMANMTPQEREQFAQRMRDRGFDPSAAGGSQQALGGGGPRTFGPRAPQTASPQPMTAQAAQTIDQLFGPLQLQITPGRVWRYIEKQLKLVRVRTGISDGTYTEIVEGDVQPGTEIVTAIELGTPRAAGSVTSSPFTPGGRPGQGFPGGRGPGR